MKKEKFCAHAHRANRLTGLPLFLSLTAIFLSVFFIANAYSERFTSKEFARAGIKVLKRAKTARIVQTNPLSESQKLAELAGQWFQTAGVTVISSDQKNADLTMTIEVGSAPQTGEKNMNLPHGNLKLATPYKEFFNVPFSGDSQCNKAGKEKASATSVLLACFEKELQGIFNAIYGAEFPAKTAFNSNLHAAIASQTF